MRRIFLAVLLCGYALNATAAELPAALKAKGALTVAVVPNYPPLEFRDPASGQLTGFDVELGEALAKKLGLKLNWQETSFDQMIPAVTTGRVDAILSGMTDYASRHEASTFIDYLRSGPAFFVQQSRADEFPDMAALWRQKRRRQPPHLVPQGDRGVERGALPRQADQRRRHRGLRRRAHPTQAGPH